MTGIPCYPTRPLFFIFLLFSFLIAETGADPQLEVATRDQVQLGDQQVPAVLCGKLLMSKDPSREIATKLIYYLMVAKSSERDCKYFKLKLVIIYLYEKVSTRVLRT